MTGAAALASLAVIETAQEKRVHGHAVHDAIIVARLKSHLGKCRGLLARQSFFNKRCNRHFRTPFTVYTNPKWGLQFHLYRR